MFRNYLKIAWRNLLKSKIFSLINILGLALGIAAFLFIYQYVRFELSYDSFQPERERIYRVVSDMYIDGALNSQNAFTVPALGPVMQTEFPEVEDYFRLTSWADSYTLIYENDQESVTFKEEAAIFADPSFVRYFSLGLLFSLSDSLLSEPNRLLLSESTAERYFGPEWENEVTAGKSLLVYNSNRDTQVNFLVEGVFRDMPGNSHLDYDVVFSHKTLPRFLPDQIPEADRIAMFENSWNPRAWYTYLVLDDQADAGIVAGKITDFLVSRNEKQSTKEVIRLQPIGEIHLNSHRLNEPGINGNPTLVYTLLVIAILIVCIAWINYINLATARAITRAKEVRLRKVVGAKRIQLVKQFLLEAGIINLIALALAITITQVMIPYMSDLTGLPSAYMRGISTASWGIFGGTLILGTILTGLYPAFVMSGFRPLTNARGKSGFSFRHGNLRKVLVVFQFVASLSLIVSTLIIYRQMEFMKNKDLGIVVDQVLVIEGPNVLAQETGFRETVDQLRNALSGYPEIKDVAATSTVPGSMDGLYRTLIRKGNNATTDRELREVLTDERYLPLIGAELLAGRWFSEVQDQNYQKVILNESGLDLYGFENAKEALNERLRMENYGGYTEYEIIGVVRNFHQSSLQNDYEPLGFFYEMYSGDYLVQLSGGQLSGVKNSLEVIEKEWKELFPNNPFNYYFLDQYFDRQYHAEQRFGKIFTLFSILTIVIGCMGLFALTSFSVGQRTKEIGIRKLLGASVQNITLLLSRDLVVLVLIASVIALPLVYFVSGLWLENYAFRINISWWVLVLPVVLVLVLATITVGVQTISTSLMNPVKSLRHE